MHQEKMRVLLRQDKCLVLQPELVAIVGRSPALLLQQMHYWLSSKDTIGKIHKGQRWIYNTYEDWAFELKTVSRSTIHRALVTLRKLGLIAVEQFSSQKGDRTNWYTINYQKIADLIHAFSTPKETKVCNQDHHVKMTPSSIQNEFITIDTKKNTKNNLNNQTSSVISINKPLQPKLQNQHPIPQQMVDIWNQHMTPEVTICLTQRRSRLLMAAFKHKFRQQLTLWTQYCQKIASSDFLMGKGARGFKATLDWALKYDSIQRICEYQFGVSKATPEKPLVLQEEKNLSEKEKRLKERLKGGFGLATYLSWFEKCHIDESDNGILMTAPTRFHKEWIHGHFHQDLEHLFGCSISLEACP